MEPVLILPQVLPEMGEIIWSEQNNNGFAFAHASSDDLQYGGRLLVRFASG
jgi:hypothetical protein